MKTLYAKKLETKQTPPRQKYICKDRNWENKKIKIKTVRYLKFVTRKQGN